MPLNKTIPAVAHSRSLIIYKKKLLKNYLFYARLPALMAGEVTF
ncbi:hypothetical protein NEOC65_000377 [Neochlamydia sp. AcF65]|nr:hypothetical protein [Neochlamydia sp. AcF65]MBS4171051.1 hypothetical protein [Neochlamydia sp. AcF95]